MAIGDTRPSAQSLRTLNPRADFASGIPEALGRLGGSLDGYRELQKQTRKYSALEAFARAQGEMDREYVELSKSAPANGVGFDRQVSDWSQKRKNEFLSTLDPDLREEFSMRFEQANQNYMTQSVVATLAMQENYFYNSFNQHLTEAATRIKANPASIEAERARALEMIKSAPLTEAQRVAAAQSAGKLLLEFQARGELEAYYMGNPGQASNAPEDIVAMLIDLESSGNPNARAAKGSAAGLGGFIEGTWIDLIKRRRPDIAAGKTDDEIAAMRVGEATADLQREVTGYYVEENSAALTAAGIPLTRGNFKLAHFAGATGAKNIIQADPNTPISQILSKKALENNASIKFNGKPFAEWTAGDMRAWAAARAGEGPDGAATPSAPPDVFTDPRYASLDLDTKLALDAASQAMARKAQLEAEAAEKARLEKNARDALIGVDQGLEDEATLLAKRNAGDLTLEAYDKAITRLGDHAMGIEKTNRFYLNVADPTFLFDPTSTTHQEDANAFFRVTLGANKLRDHDTDYVMDTLLPVVGRIGFLPKEARTHIELMMSSANTEDVNFAAQLINNVAAQNPAHLIGLNANAIADAAYFGTFLDMGQEGEVAQIIAERRKPGYNEVFSRLMTSGKTEAGKLTLDEIVNAVDNRWRVFSGQPTPDTLTTAIQMQGDFNAMFALEYARTGGDADAAKDLAAQRLRTIWGMHNGQLMRYPPELVGLPKATFSGKNARDAQLLNLGPRQVLRDYEWMDYFVRMRNGLPEDAELRYIPIDGQTQSAAAMGRPVPYLVMYRRPGFTDWDFVGYEDFQLTRELIGENLQGAQDRLNAPSGGPENLQ